MSSQVKATPRAAHVPSAHTAGIQVSAGGSLGSKARGSRSFYEYKRVYFALAAAVGVLAVFDWIPKSLDVKRKVLAPFSPFTYVPVAFQVAGLTLFFAIVAFFLTSGRPYLLFAWNCFIKPFLTKKANGVDTDEHQKRLEQFYEGQADIYDVTRRRLLRGRSTMLKLCAAQLRQYYPLREAGNPVSELSSKVKNSDELPSPPLSPSNPRGANRRFAWIDIGGGTGENIERMNQFFPISNFDKVYLVDITPSLCEVARKRFARLGWTNVTVLCMDATKFKVPEEDGNDIEIALITLSYSLSMMETFFPLVDSLTTILCPTGILGVADFYVSPKRSSDPTRQLGWFMRWFWSIWFDLDNIYLHPSRREYLEYRFKTIKSLNGKNMFIRPFVKIPYYVWLGGQKVAEEMPLLSLDDSAPANDNDETQSNASDDQELDSVELRSESQHHVSANHVHGTGAKWRQVFDPKLIPRFTTYIYAFAWEDPRVDLEFLDLTPEDKMLIITSGGCNALEYAAKVGPARIHCVDLNPCQNHMLELKLAGLSSMTYNDFWRLFGDGYIPGFGTLLDTHFSPFLSPYAYHFWKQNADFKSLFTTGCSGLAIRVFQFVVKARGLTKSVNRMCHAHDLETQWKIWETELRPHFLSKWLIALLNNDHFLWGALGVPPAQMQMLLEEGSAHKYVVDTFDPVIRNTLLRDDNYFYYMCLMGRYRQGNTPAYLDEEGFKVLQTDARRLEAIRIHTDTILNVLKREVPDGDLTRVILMDHLDWFSDEDADAEISAVAQKLKKGGRAYWRSAGKYPWYNTIFEKRGFRVYPCQIREEPKMYIDRVNMYASFWCGEKL
ncbi:uncharacterized protein BJ171DRAFT_499010 [Polychytrium aggregatum]|uniref:uncharacterized protein n=1 Tax=Polychytrium aggregatum TaxID=110093 RepID=UPI0022FDEBAF|nr:uncharacterized protein BJ171DRAFT_499010 [Polychytrium aggregatum]KAI9206168.1 hypothetical protein BJ171DRAFT_499010 [Polychytrium aggregatum]